MAASPLPVAVKLAAPWLVRRVELRTSVVPAIAWTEPTPSVSPASNSDPEVAVRVAAPEALSVALCTERFVAAVRLSVPVSVFEPEEIEPPWTVSVSLALAVTAVPPVIAVPSSTIAPPWALSVTVPVVSVSVVPLTVTPPAVEVSDSGSVAETVTEEPPAPPVNVSGTGCRDRDASCAGDAMRRSACLSLWPWR